MRKTLCTLILSLGACDWHYNPTQPAPEQATPIAYFPKDTSVSYNAYPPRFAPMDSIHAERAFDSLLAIWPTTYAISAHCTAKRTAWYVGAFREGYETPHATRYPDGWMDAESEGDPSTFCFSYNHE